MTEYIQDLLEVLELGSRVEIVYETAAKSSIVTGKLEKKSEMSIRIIKEDGRPAVIRTDTIVAAEELPLEMDTSVPASITIPEVTVAQPVQDIPIPEYAFAEMSPLPDFNVETQVAEIRRDVKEKGAREIRKEIFSILDTLQASIKARAVNEKYQNLCAKMDQLWEMCFCDVDYKSYYLLLGTIAYAAEDYNYAIEPFVRAKKYRLAEKAALHAENAELQSILHICAILSGEWKQVDQKTAEICLQYQDAQIVSELLNQYRNDAAVCEQIAACGQFLWKKAELKGRVTGSTALEVAESSANELNTVWKTESKILKRWEEFKSYQYPVRSKSDENTKTGTINFFDPEKQYGWIDHTIYFSVNQVQEDNGGMVLRRLLSRGRGVGQTVTYSLGYRDTISDEIAATAITLIGKELEIAQKKLDQAMPERMKGFVAEFQPDNEWGRIQQGDKVYGFYLSNVDDPYLQEYYQSNFCFREQDVTFEPVFKQGKKPIAIHIRWLNPDPEERKALDKSISNSKLDAWKKILAMESEGITENTYAEWPYQGLEKLDEELSKPLTWTKANHTVLKRNSAVQLTKAPTQNLVTLQKTWNLPKGHPVIDEKKIVQELEGDPNCAESKLGDLINIYLQQPERLEKDALPALEKYGKYVSREKLLNMKISVFTKLKKYEELCPLYEELVQMTTLASRKSHALQQYIRICIKLKEYSRALTLCGRWERFYQQQGRNHPDYLKIRRQADALKQLKAVCLYYTGQISEAQELAKELLHQNPNNETIQAILNGELEHLQQSEEENWDLEFDEESSEPSTFTAYLIDKCDLSSVSKASQIENGVYRGNAAQAEKEINRLLEGGRKTAKTRSDIMFAACKILDEVDGIAGTPPKATLAARGMASWGDYMAEQAYNQMDTTRMAYLEAISNLKAMEQDSINAYNRYLKSYFLGQSELSAYIKQQTAQHNKDPRNTDILRTHTLSSVLAPQFLIGVLYLKKALHSDALSYELYKALYESDNVLSALCEALQVQLNTVIDAKTITYPNFEEYLRQAERITEPQPTKLKERLSGCVADLTKNAVSESKLQSLKREKWESFLFRTDLERLERFYKIFERMQNYFSSVEFDKRSDDLRTVISEIDRLQGEILKEPTTLSYELFRPQLDTVLKTVEELQDQLFRDFKPQLSLNEKIQPSVLRNQLIQIQLEVANKTNYQEANNLEIVDITGEDIDSLASRPDPIPYLRGGESKELILTVQPKLRAIEVGSFSIGVVYAYRYNDAAQCSIKQEETKRMTLTIHNKQFIPFHNPYKQHIGSEMQDKNMFYGRDALIEDIIQKIGPDDSGRMHSGSAVCMYGQTRTGKSSILYHLKNRVMEAYGDRVSVWDIGNIGDIMSESPEQYLQAFLYKMLDIGDDAMRDCPELLSALEDADLQPPRMEILNGTETQASALFNSYMRRINQILKRHNRIILLLADEFTYLHDMIKHKRVNDHFMKFWKALLQDYLVAAVIAGQDDFPEFISEYQNEFACMDQIPVTYLAEEPAKKLIEEPMERENPKIHQPIFWHDGCVDQLFSLTAGSAFLTISLCSELVDYLNSKGTQTVTIGIVDDFLKNRVISPRGTPFLKKETFEPQIRERGQDLDEENLDILRSVAVGSYKSGREDAPMEEIHCDSCPERKEELVDRLVKRDVLVRQRCDQGYDRYYIRVKLLEKWLLSESGVYKI